MAFGTKLAAHLFSPTVVLLEGDLGSGKTTLTKGIAVGVGAAREDEVTSPTFTLVHEYSRESSGGLQGETRRLFHVDLYRIEDPGEIRSLGLDEIFDSGSTVVIEWGERLAEQPARPYFKVRLDHLNNQRRRIQVLQVSE